MGGGVCLSVCMSVYMTVRLSVDVPYRNIAREWKGLGSPNLVGWKPISRVNREPI